MGDTALPTVVVADDSRIMRELVCDVVRAANMQVVAAVGDGAEAVQKCLELKPDVLSLDISMPGMGGMDVLAELSRIGSPVRVVVVSAFSGRDASCAVDALAAGAVSVVRKPTATGSISVTDFQTDLEEKLVVAVEAVSNITVSRQADTALPMAAAGGGGPVAVDPGRGPALGLPPARTRFTRDAPPQAWHPSGTPILVIACSTSGPQALNDVIPYLPTSLGAGSLIVQHMPPGFTAILSSRLNDRSPITVREARDGETPDPRTVLMAPAGFHLRMDANRRLLVADDPPIGGLKPRADLLIEDVARVYGNRTVLVVLTGMGKDGLEGARAVRRVGGRIIAQAEEGCVVYGMSRNVVEAGLADFVEPLGSIARRILTEVGGARST